jgi:FlaA1/EpsC-like NDP-sugar epimerase
LTALLASIFGRNEGAKSPWKQLYTVLVYLTCIPGIFAVTLNVYLFLFERQSVFDTNIFTQILPIFSMIITLWLVRKNVSFDDIPGFDKIGGLIMIIAALIIFMWFLEKTHILAITVVPFSYFLILFIVLLVIIRFGWKKLFTNTM